MGSLRVLPLWGEGPLWPLSGGENRADRKPPELRELEEEPQERLPEEEPQEELRLEEELRKLPERLEEEWEEERWEELEWELELWELGMEIPPLLGLSFQAWFFMTSSAQSRPSTAADRMPPA